MKETNEKKALSTVKLAVILAVVVAIASVSIYALAKYVSSTNGNAEAEVAKWYFQLKDGIEQTQEIDFPVTRTDGNTSVAPTKLAPGTCGVIPIVVDTTGTQVHMKYDLTITIQNCPTNLQFYSNDTHKNKYLLKNIERSGTGEEGDPKIATITITKYVDKNSHGEHEEVIYWEWPFETGTGNVAYENNLTDTKDMTKGAVTGQVVAVGTQLLEVQDNPVEEDAIFALFETDTNTLKLSSYDFSEEQKSGNTYYGNVYKSSGQPWSGKRSSITTVEIMDEIYPINTRDWFYNCTKLTSIKNIEFLDTSEVTSMNSMFSSCSKLTSLDVSGFDTSKVTDMNAMFENCRFLTSLDVSGFDTSKVTDMSSMFCYCSNLTTIYASDNFKTNQVTSSGYMFYDCSNLIGGNETTYASAQVKDCSYAVIDTNETPGYFTAKTN